LLIADTNWFYSTLAQSTAAIVGLMGGFLAQQLLAQRREIADRRAAVRDGAIAFLNGSLIPRRIALQGVADSMSEYISRIDKEVDVHSPPNASFSVMGANPQPPVFGTQGLGRGPTLPDFRDRLEESRQAAEAFRDALPNDLDTLAESLRTRGGLPALPEGNKWLEDLPWADQTKPNAPDPIAWLPFAKDVARERWQELEGAASDLALQLTNLRALLVPPSIYALLGILSLLLTAGVIVPMFFLTARDDSSRCWLLAGFIVLSLALLVFFANEVRRLRRADRLAPDTF
jgi:hypothetical protein